jgi:hypothetical protein
MNSINGKWKQGRFLLRNVSQRLYFGEDQQWVLRREAARGFENSMAAIRFVFEQRLQNLEVVMAFEDPSYDIVVWRTVMDGSSLAIGVEPGPPNAEPRPVRY